MQRKCDQNCSYISRVAGRSSFNTLLWKICLGLESSLLALRWMKKIKFSLSAKCCINGNSRSKTIFFLTYKELFPASIGGRSPLLSKLQASNVREASDFFFFIQFSTKWFFLYKLNESEWFWLIQFRWNSLQLKNHIYFDINLRFFTGINLSKNQTEQIYQLCS